MRKLVIEETFPLDRWNFMDSFLCKAYSHSYVLRHRRLFEWMYGVPAEGDQARVVCAYHGEEIVAIVGYLVTDLFWGSTDCVVTGAWPVNWIALEQFRVGVGWPLMRRLQRMFRVLVINGPSVENKKLLPSLGFTIYERNPRYVGVFSPDEVRSLLAKGEKKVEEDIVSRYLLRVEKAGLASDVRVIDKKIEVKDFDPEWKRYPDLKFGVVRSRHYLNYKYLSHPYFRYRVLVCGKSMSPSVCVYRVEETSGAARMKVGRILEFFHPQGEEGAEQGKRLLEYALGDLRSEKCAFCDFYCSSATFGNVLRSVGMGEENSSMFPHRLNPIEWTLDGGNQGVEIYVSEPSCRVPLLDEMYVTKSDGDQDRPNMPFEDACGYR